jgi:hypothetical protein
MAARSDLRVRQLLVVPLPSTRAARPIPRIRDRLDLISGAFRIIHRQLYELEEVELTRRTLTPRDVRRARSLAFYLSCLPGWARWASQDADRVAARALEVLGGQTTPTGRAKRGLRVFNGGRA